MIYKISSKQNEKIKEIVKLNDTKYVNQVGLFKVEGFHAFEMALNAKVVKEIFVTKEVENIPKDIDQYVVSLEVMKKISSTTSPQGIISICFTNKTKEDFGDKILYLDSVSDPGNLGTILRTSLAFGYNDIILSNGCVSQYNEKVLQSCQGAIFKLNILNNFNIEKLKSKYQIIATEIKGSTSLESLVPNKKHILVLGNEAHGVSKPILELADKRVRIEIKNIESLNVAIAGAIAMYKFNNN